MTWLKQWFARHPMVADYLEGAGMVWVPLPPPAHRPLYIRSDFAALAADWREAAVDLGDAMKRAGAGGR